MYPENLVADIFLIAQPEANRNSTAIANKANARGDHAQALHIFIALAQGSIEAQSYAGFMFSICLGRVQDQIQATRWYRSLLKFLLAAIGNCLLPRPLQTQVIM